jgi:hypothetical protein
VELGLWTSTKANPLTIYIPLILLFFVSDGRTALNFGYFGFYQLSTVLFNSGLDNVSHSNVEVF